MEGFTGALPRRSESSNNSGFDKQSDTKKEFNARPSNNRTTRQAQVHEEPVTTRQVSMLSIRTSSKVAICSRRTVENKYFIGVTSLLTVYALCGNDIRIILFEKSADLGFSLMVFVCLVAFTAEFFMSCLGKKDYFLGFFFWLDLFSTLSLILDLHWVADKLAEQTNSEGDGNTGNMRSGRTARLGARAGRVVRVLRLVRILKLWKAYHETKNLQKSKDDEKKMDPGSEDDWDESDMEADTKPPESNSRGESRVGSKLSEMTTRRCICLILAMLLVIPSLRPEESGLTPRSPAYGADTVSQAFKAFVDGSGGPRLNYERALLNMVYYHNWFAQYDSELYCPSGVCANGWYGQLFWVGIMGTDGASVQNLTQYEYAGMRESVVSTFEQNQDTENIYNYGTLPADVKEVMWSPWRENCDNDGYTMRGFSMLSGSAQSQRVNCPAALRLQEIVKFSPRLQTGEEFEQWHFAFFFDIRPFQKMDALWNLAVVSFILVLLICGSMMFSHDANVLVLSPVEKMITRVEAIRENPLIAMQMADQEFKAEEMAKAKLRRRSHRHHDMIQACIAGMMCSGSQRDMELMETAILEKTIIKLGSLLALGFGEAGVNIIGQNLRGADTAGVNAMIQGTLVDCVIGLARVRDFSVATEVLHSKIMTFGNQIAEIVHGVCSEFQGAPNKNSGDSFLVIWLFPHDDPKEKSRLAEMSVVAFAKILGSVHQSPVLATYRGHPGLQNRLGSNCRVNLSFGLHAGWAVEGAVGSEFKIDASYLSPHVSIAKSVELATSTYGVSLMVAQSVTELCSQEMVAKCRLIDNVIITGSAKPMKLYCVDLDYMGVEADLSSPPAVVWNVRQRFKVRQHLEMEKKDLWENGMSMAKVFDEELVIMQMRQRYTVEFFELFRMGYENYSQGEWTPARRLLSSTRTLLGVEDGPSTALLRFMEAPHNFQAPKDWNGVRELPREGVFRDKNTASI